jgi:hypothetical protein
MNGRRAIFGACALFALLISAFAAQGASAATKGTTVFTCTSTALVKDFATEHCNPSDPPGTSFGHVSVNENTTTHFTATNEKTNATTNGSTQSKLKATVAGSAIELVATGVHATGGLENKKEASGEHYVHGHEIVIKYTGVTETLLGCGVVGIPGGANTIETKKLTATTAAKGDGIEFKPEEGSTFAEFQLTGCVVANTYKVVGSIICTPSGATIGCEHNPVTAQKTLRLQSALGPVAGYDGKVTVTASHKEEGVGTTKPLSVTTVETT